jgi:ribosomal protein S18 acetylase RimI-like enzyme
LNFEFLLPGYRIGCGSTRDQALLVKFMKQTYQEMFPNQDFSHLTQTVEQYFSNNTPLWWVYFVDENSQKHRSPGTEGNTLPSPISPIGCLWVGNSINQIGGDRHAHIFLLYVMPEYRRQGIAKALMKYLEKWAFARGDQQIGLQVFQSNPPALNLYQQMGYQTQSLWMIKPLK